MRIKESTIRRILREEYRRMLVEATPEESSGGMTKSAPLDANQPMPEAFVKQVIAAYQKSKPGVANEDVNALGAYLVQANAVQANLQKVVDAVNAVGVSQITQVATNALTNWPKVSTNGKDSPTSQAVVGTLSQQAIKTAPPVDRCKALIAALSTEKSYTGGSDRVGGERDFNMALGVGVGQYQTRTNESIEAIGDSILNKLVGDAALVAGFNLKGTVARVQAASSASTGSTGETSYKLQKDETVSMILNRFYGIPMSNASLSLYQDFGNMQTPQIKDFHRMKIGTELKLPPTLGQYKRKQ
jgi:hypothetical protein